MNNFARTTARSRRVVRAVPAFFAACALVFGLLAGSPAHASAATHATWSKQTRHAWLRISARQAHRHHVRLQVWRARHTLKAYRKYHPYRATGSGPANQPTGNGASGNGPTATTPFVFHKPDIAFANSRCEWPSDAVLNQEISAGERPTVNVVYYFRLTGGAYTLNMDRNFFTTNATGKPMTMVGWTSTLEANYDPASKTVTLPDPYLPGYTGTTTYSYEFVFGPWNMPDVAPSKWTVDDGTVVGQPDHLTCSHVIG